MSLPFDPPLEPMLAKLTKSFPTDGDFLFEPKWDGFRALVFRDGDELFTQSRDKKRLDRYFPELQQPLRDHLPDRCVLDGEIIIAADGALDFDALQQRIHPADSRVQKLALETPAAYVAFDLLALGDEDLRGVAQAERRRRLEGALAGAGSTGAASPVRLTPATSDPELAQRWFVQLEGAGLDGVMAKPAAGIYAPKKRAMLKIKHVRTADCVVAGFRWHKKGPGSLVGSLLLGLHDADGVLHHVGITSSFKMAYREELARELADLREEDPRKHPWARWADPGREADPGGQRLPGGLSRWSRGKDLSFVPLRCERVCEVKYDHMQGDRFRHATTFVRWRDDKPPEACDYDQLEEPVAFDLAEFLPGLPTPP